MKLQITYFLFLSFSNEIAAEGFVAWYYPTINEGKPVSSGYVNNNKTYQAASHPPADICINGLAVATPEEWDKLLEQQRFTKVNQGKGKPVVRYNVETYDVHVLNSNYTFAAPEELIKKYNKNSGVRMVMLVTVSGTVQFGADKSSPKQHFHDVFTLVPNWEVIARAGSKATRRYIICSQNYRAY